MSLHQKVLLLVHPSSELRAALAPRLRAAGSRVMQASGDEEAWELIQSVLEPDAVVAHLEPATPAGSWVGERIRARNGIAVVALADERRLAFRRGFAHVVGPPFDAEELMLVTSASLESLDREGSLSGDLAKMALPDVLQTASINGQSAHVTLRQGARSAEIWLRDGQVINARIEAWGGDSAISGREAVYRLVGWQEGTFSVEFGPVAAAQLITESTTHLLLEAMRRMDEARRSAEPGHAHLPEDPPPPTATQKADHLSLLLLNVSASWLSSQFVPKILGQMVTDAKQQCLERHPILDRFEVGEHGRVALRAPASEVAEAHIEPLVRAASAWLDALYARVERAMPGRFSLTRLGVLTGAHEEEIVELGFAAALGWSDMAAAADSGAGVEAPDATSPPGDTLETVDPSLSLLATETLP